MKDWYALKVLHKAGKFPNYYDFIIINVKSTRATEPASHTHHHPVVFLVDTKLCWKE